MMLASRPAARPFTASRPASRRAAAPVAPLPSRPSLRTAVAETEEAVVGPNEFGPEGGEDVDMGPRGRRGPVVEKGMELKHFLPLPKPAHLVYIKPTVAVVAGVASRSSVGLKMTAGEQQLERYVIEYYARSVK